jgi:hypothetical protein
VGIGQVWWVGALFTLGNVAILRLESLRTACAEIHDRLDIESGTRCARVGKARGSSAVARQSGPQRSRANESVTPAPL